MICTTIQNKTFDQIIEALGQCEMAEIRLDRCQLTDSQIRDCFSEDLPLVATCRIAEVMAAEPSLSLVGATTLCEKRLIAAIEAGAAYVDVELEAPKQMSKRVRQAAHENGTVFIRSFHDFKGTGTKEELEEICRKCRFHGADIVKLVTFANSEDDVATVMSLYQTQDCPDDNHSGNGRPGRLIAFCMGQEGQSSRIASLSKGAPFTYAAFSDSDLAAPGQLSTEQMRKAIYGDRKFIDCGPLQMPSSKSFAQRAIIAAALAGGESVLRGYTPCGDTDAALDVARLLGAKVEILSDKSASVNNLNQKRLSIKGIDAFPDCLELSEINVGESGLLARLMLALLPQLSSTKAVIDGEGTLKTRVMSGVKEIMSALGVEVISQDDNVSVPLALNGKLSSGKFEISGKYGSQLISGLLMSLAMGEKNSTLVVSDPKSIPYMFITLDVMKKFGVKVSNEMAGNRDFLESGGDWSLCREITFKIKGGQRYRPADFALEGDWSAAAAFLVAGAIFGKIELSGLDTASVQADLSIMDVLMEAGAGLSQLDGERGNITVQRAPLNSFEIDATHCPDLFPILAVLAAFCNGTSRIAGTDRLEHKECNRAEAILHLLSQMGVSVRLEDNQMIIDGLPLPRRILTGKLLKGGNYSSYHDHRMAMALKVASLGADSPIVIDDETCVAKSFPLFNEYFNKLTKNE